jgi:hypothetical protein
MRISMELFWGLLFIIAGITLMAKYLFHINVPVIRILLGVVLIYLGLVIALGRFGFKSGKEIIFSDGSLDVTDVNNEYNIIFGNGIINLTGENEMSKNKNIEINTIFASGRIRIDQSIPAVVKVDSAFGSANFPDGTSINFGDHTYKTKAYREGEPFVPIKASVVFGQLNIENPDRAE